jgi:serine/threonine protein kinase
MSGNAYLDESPYRVDDYIRNRDSNSFTFRLQNVTKEFRVLKKIGSGEFAKVYVVEHEYQKMVLRKIKRKKIEPHVIALIIEANALIMNNRHTNLAEIYDIFLHVGSKNKLFMTMVLFFEI